MDADFEKERGEATDVVSLEYHAFFFFLKKRPLGFWFYLLLDFLEGLIQVSAFSAFKVMQLLTNPSSFLPTL